MLKLRRKHVLIICAAVLLFFYFLNRGLKIASGNFAEGKITGINVFKSHATRDLPATSTSKPVVEFFVGGRTYHIYGAENSGYGLQQKVRVLFNTNDPDDAYIFSFTGFWWESLLLTILMPGLLLTLAIFSFFYKEDIFIINLKKFHVKIERPETEEDRQRKAFYTSFRRKK